MGRKLNQGLSRLAVLVAMLSLTVSVAGITMIWRSNHSNPLALTAWYGYKAMVPSEESWSNDYISSYESRRIAFEQDKGVLESDTRYVMLDGSKKFFRYTQVFEYDVVGQQVIFRSPVTNIVRDDGYWHLREESVLLNQLDFDVEFYLSRDQQELVTVHPIGPDSLNYYRRADQY